MHAGGKESFLQAWIAALAADAPEWQTFVWEPGHAHPCRLMRPILTNQHGVSGTHRERMPFSIIDIVDAC